MIPVGAKLYLVSCVSEKRSAPCAARDLYVSSLFRKARVFVEAQHAPWFILSAEHGLVHPDTVIAPYDRTLKGMPAADRRAWARKVLGSLEIQLASVDEVVFLAGQRYREFLEGELRSRVRVEVPMAGLTIGRQLQWLLQHSGPR